MDGFIETFRVTLRQRFQSWVPRLACDSERLLSNFRVRFLDLTLPFCVDISANICAGEASRSLSFKVNPTRASQQLCMGSSQRILRQCINANAMLHPYIHGSASKGDILIKRPFPSCVGRYAQLRIPKIPCSLQDSARPVS